MKFKFILVFVFILCVTFSAVKVNAMTIEERQNLINSLQQQLTLLWDKVRELTGQNPPSSVPDYTAPASCGDGTCQDGESSVSCSQDCVDMSKPAHKYVVSMADELDSRCGDGILQCGENVSNCPVDYSTGRKAANYNSTCKAGQSTSPNAISIYPGDQKKIVVTSPANGYIFNWSSVEKKIDAIKWKSYLVSGYVNVFITNSFGKKIALVMGFKQYDFAERNMWRGATVVPIPSDSYQFNSDWFKYNFGKHPVGTYTISVESTDGVVKGQTTIKIVDSVACASIKNGITVYDPNGRLAYRSQSYPYYTNGAYIFSDGKVGKIYSNFCQDDKTIHNYACGGPVIDDGSGVYYNLQKCDIGCQASACKSGFLTSSIKEGEQWDISKISIHKIIWDMVGFRKVTDATLYLVNENTGVKNKIYDGMVMEGYVSVYGSVATQPVSTDVYIGNGVYKRAVYQFNTTASLDGDIPPQKLETDITDLSIAKIIGTTNTSGVRYHIELNSNGFSANSNSFSIAGSPSTAITTNCSPNWICTDWSACSNGQTSKKCVDKNSCGTSWGDQSATKSCGCRQEGERISSAEANPGEGWFYTSPTIESLTLCCTGLILKPSAPDYVCQKPSPDINCVSEGHYIMGQKDSTGNYRYYMPCCPGLAKGPSVPLTSDKWVCVNPSKKCAIKGDSYKLLGIPCCSGLISGTDGMCADPVPGKDCSSEGQYHYRIAYRDKPCCPGLVVVPENVNVMYDGVCRKP